MSSTEVEFYCSNFLGKGKLVFCPADQHASPLVGGLQRPGGGDHLKLESLSVSGQVGSMDIVGSH